MEAFAGLLEPELLPRKANRGICGSNHDKINVLAARFCRHPTVYECNWETHTHTHTHICICNIYRARGQASY